MKLRKPISAALAAATLVSSFSVVSYAAEDEAMKTALTYVKQRVSIPEDLENFNHSASLYNDRTRYSFTWDKQEENNYESVNVTICGKVITNYRHDKYEDVADDEGQKYTFAKLTDKQLKEKAKEWVRKLNPTVCENIELVGSSLKLSLNSDNARFTIRRVANGVQVNGQTGYVTINKNTGDLIAYNLNWVMGAGFADPEKAITVAQAIDGFKAEIPLELVYTTEYDYEKRIHIPHLIYRQSVFGKIDALTGKLSTFEDSFDYYENEKAETEEDCDEEVSVDSGAANTVTFTQAELEKLEKEGSLIKADEALADLKELGIFQIASNAEISQSNCYYDDTYGAYIRYFSFEANNNQYYPIGIDPTDPEKPVEESSDYSGGTATINAETGDLIRFSAWSSDGYDSKKLTEKNTLSLMKKYLSEIAGKKAEQFKLETPDFNYSEYGNNGKPKKGAYITFATTESPRYVNKIPCTRENVSMSVNGNKKITDYRMTHYNIKYPSAKKIISEDKAYEMYFEQVNYKLNYCCAIKNKKTLTALIYKPTQTLYMDAFTGTLVNSDGSEIEPDELEEYTDLEGSKYKEIAEKLLAYDIKLMDKNGKLNENKSITRKEFTNLAYGIGCYFHAKDGPKSALTRQYAAKILTCGVLSDRCAEIKGIFKSPFSDVKESSSYIGYIVVADALGYIKGTNGKFRPSAKVTRGEALKLIYDYISENG